MTALSSQFQFVIMLGTATCVPPMQPSYLTATSVAIPSAYYAADGSTNFYSIPQHGDGY